MQPQNFLTDRVRGHTFLKNYLNSTGKVIDLGMNKGDFARAIYGKYGCSVMGLEANPILASAVCRLDGIGCKNAAVSALDGSVKFSIDEENPEASKIVPDSTPISDKVIVVPSVSLSTFFREVEAEQIDLLKVDIEGAELDLVETTEPEIFQRCAQITIEFHSFLYPSQAARIERAIALLSGLGFHYIDFSRRRMDVLFINSRIIDITGFARALLVIQKYQRGIAGRLGRLAAA
jgi:FkbM family methyltransferase